MGSGVYNYTYTASTPGNYTIYIRLDGVYQVRNGPFSVRAVSYSMPSIPLSSPFPLFLPSLTHFFSATDPSKTVVGGDGIRNDLYSSYYYDIIVTLKTSDGIQRTTGGDIVTAQFPQGFFLVKPTIDNNDGTYTISYTCKLGLTPSPSRSIMSL